jgi:hypothetical protein
MIPESMQKASAALHPCSLNHKSLTGNGMRRNKNCRNAKSKSVSTKFFIRVVIKIPVRMADELGFLATLQLS